MTGVEDGRPAYLWVDGVLTPWADATIHLSMLAWSSVSAVFEGVRAYRDPSNGQLYVFRLADHIERLQGSMKVLGMPPTFSRAELEHAVLQVLRSNEADQDWYLMPLAYFRGWGPHLISVEDQPVQVVVFGKAASSGLPRVPAIRCGVSSWRRLADDVMPPRVKAVPNYLNGRLAMLEARRSGDECAIMLNERGKVAEAPGACLFIVRGGVAATPRVTDSILESITRDAVLRLLAETIGIPVREREIDRSELYLAEEVFLCGTGWEVTPVIEVDGFPVGEGVVGPVTLKLMELYEDVVRGRDARYSLWRTPVYERSPGQSHRDASATAQIGRGPTS